MSPRRLFSPDDPSPFDLQKGDLGFRSLDDDLAAEEEGWDMEIAFLREQEAAEARGQEIDDLAREGGLEWLK